MSPGRGCSSGRRCSCSPASGDEPAAGGFSAADTWRNDIDGVGSLTKAGSGSLTLSGENTYEGGTTVEDGELRAVSATAFGVGSVTVVDGVLSEGTDDALIIGGDLTLGADSELELTVDDATPAFEVAGEATFDGNLLIELAPGFVPADDQVIGSFASVAAGSDFDQVEFSGLPAGYTLEVQVRDGALHLVNTSAAPATLTAGTPSVSGSAVVGETLTASAGTWEPSPVAFTYQWLRGTTPIDGATSATYTAAKADLGRLLSVQVTGSKQGFASETRTATAAGVVTAARGETPVTPSDNGKAPTAAADRRGTGSLASTGVDASIAAPLAALGMLILGAGALLARRAPRARRS